MKVEKDNFVVLLICCSAFLSDHVLFVLKLFQVLWLVWARS